MLMRTYRAMFARRCFQPMNRFLFNLSLRGLGVCHDGVSDPAHTGEFQFLRTLSASWVSPPTMLDVGAHLGDYAKRVKQVAPQASVYALEPHPRTFSLLQDQARQYGFRAFNVGCGATEGTVPLFDCAFDDGSVVASVYPAAVASQLKAKPVSHSVRIITLDQFVKDQDLRRIDLVKIDTEGHERLVLEGFRDTIRRNIVDVIQFEFNAMNVASRTLFKDFYDILPQYYFYRILPRSLAPLGRYSSTLCELFAFQNVVAVRNGSHVKL